MQNHYFNEQGYYTYSGYANPDNLPPLNATREAPEQREGYCPKWSGETWEYVKDMRGTKYYLPDGSEYEVTEIEGQLPEGANLTKPEPTEAENAQQRIAEIQQQLTVNDLASVRPLRAKVAGTATEFDETRLAELEAQAQALRAELVTLATKLQELSDQTTE
ncbi:hypothetical protein [Halodesulfovibrio aestuarii]|uniref:Uncharacterized protein n=1 Tax=Halodesulfovibrio aestuarii TaxID=126333 RepID=A0ABV4JSK2_9BACT